MKHRYKKNAMVNIIETGYLYRDIFSHHGSWEVKIATLIPEEEWKEPLVPEYEVMYNRKRYRIPEYSIDPTTRSKK